MKAEIIAIGTEILLGEIVDTNSAYIAQRLPELGIGPGEAQELRLPYARPTPEPCAPSPTASRIWALIT